MKYLSLLQILLLMSCSSSNNSLQKITLQTGDHEVTLQVEIADSPVERAEGLMGRTELPDGQGMLFIFPEPQNLSFWMKNTMIPLDILFFDSQKKFIGWQSMEPCKIEPCKLYSSKRPATYALEVASGFFVEQIEPHLQGSKEPLQLRFPEE